MSTQDYRQGSGAPQRQFVFIQDEKLEEAPTVRHLLRFVPPVKTDAPSLSLMDRFTTDESLYALPVVDVSAKPVALVERKQYIEFFSKPYRREIFSQRSIVELLAYDQYGSSEPIIVDESCGIEAAAQMMIEAGMHHMVTGFLISRENRYCGVANGHDLLNIITQRKQAELYHLAHFDSLTGIPNRMLLGDRLGQACRDAERTKKMVALLFIDVDRFKQINDSLGHSAGDVVLCKIVERLKTSARRADTVARLAGDEFVILMEDLIDPADVDLVAGRLLRSMEEPIALHGHSLVATVSAGSAVYPVDDTNISALLAKADAAMYAAKTSGRNSYRKYAPGTAMYNPASLMLVNDLRQAIEHNELDLHFQPQMCLASGRILGVEALLRWQHPMRGAIPPAQFIPIAEESGLIVPLGEWVLQRALRQMQAWQQSGNVPPLRMSINISALQFHQREFPAFLRAQLEHYVVNPLLVELELTESALMHHVEDVLHALEEIKSFGVSLAIDDFGTGFSSLSYLRRFPIDRLKIDQSFVRDIHCTPVNESIACAIVALANSLGLDTVAEGIETPAEKAVMERLGCTEGQGFLIARPLPAWELAAWLASSQLFARVQNGAMLADVDR